MTFSKTKILREKRAKKQTWYNIYILALCLQKGGAIMLDLTLFLVVVRLVIPLAYELGKDYGMKWIEKHFDDDED